MSDNKPSPSGAGVLLDKIMSQDTDLDAQIHAAELRVIERNARLQRGIRKVKRQVLRKSTSGLAMVLLGVSAVVLATMWLRRPRSGSAGVSSSGSLSFRGGHFLNALGALWPSLPQRVRDSMPRGLPPLLMSVVLPIFEQLWRSLSRKRAQSAQAKPPVSTAPAVDLARYVGHWYEYARLPTRYEKDCVGNVMATYAQMKSPGYVSVLNTCLRQDGQTQAARGVARVQEGSGNARLKVSFMPRLLRWLPGMWGDYWILLVSPDYRFALVGTPDRRSLWLLSRTPYLRNEDQQLMLDHARAQGYDTALIKRTMQRQ